jgi:hypothetical protein
MFPNRVPMDRDTLSPEPLVYLFILVCLPESPKRSPPTYGEKHKVTFRGAPHRRKAYIQWGVAWFPKCVHAYVQSCFFLSSLTEFCKVPFYCSDFVIDRS